MSTKRKRHTPEQVVRKLTEADRLLAQGAGVFGLETLELVAPPEVGLLADAQLARDLGGIWSTTTTGRTHRWATEPHGAYAAICTH